jgi:LytS/YehU family sensor histidine kinase
MLRHLVSYLTASLPTLRAAHSTLGRELALATAYLNVQKIRMGARLGVEIDVPLALHEIEVPPMMLATLAENAIIHGLGPLPEGGRIRIVARAKDGRLTVQVADDGRGLQDAWGAGIGLANIRARLHSEFRDNANVTLASGPQRGVTATIDLPLPADMHALAA